MTLNNAYKQYATNRIMTASPAELTLLLYDGAIKFCNIAVNRIGENDIQGAHDNIVRAEKIIDYLRETLNMKYEVSHDFERMYVYISQRLVEANSKKDTEILKEVLEHLNSIRETWKEVMRQAKVS